LNAIAFDSKTVIFFRVAALLYDFNYSNFFSSTSMRKSFVSGYSFHSEEKERMIRVKGKLVSLLELEKDALLFEKLSANRA